MANTKNNTRDDDFGAWLYERDKKNGKVKQPPLAEQHKEKQTVTKTAKKPTKK